MEHVQRQPAPFPWRAATVVVGAVALVELVVLLAIGVARLAPSSPKAAHVVARPPAHAQPVAHVRAPVVPLRPRSRVHVLVLNGNGVSGAAAVQAARLQGDGYRIAAATNAQRHDYAQSMVMYVPGWAGEARRLAHEADVRIVSPVDGLRRADLHGSTVILLLGNSAP